MFLNVNGISMYYEQTGAGRPLIMVHGNGEDHTIFNEAAAVLKDHFTVYAVDSRDHGLSSKVNGLHYLDMAEDLLAPDWSRRKTDVANTIDKMQAAENSRQGMYCLRKEP